MLVPDGWGGRVLLTGLTLITVAALCSHMQISVTSMAGLLMFSFPLAAATGLLESASSVMGPAGLVAAGAIGYHVLVTPRVKRGALHQAEEERFRAKQDLIRARTYPGWVPNAWYKLCDSKDIKVGAVKEIHALGRVFAVFRAADGSSKISVMDAHCPHMGANMAVGGRVVGDCLQCPFHQWEISGMDGSVANIPYDDKIPSKAKGRVWPSREFLNMILVYFDAEGREPPYEPVPIPEVSSGLYVASGGWDSRDIRMHIMEFTDNSGDTQHFPFLHSQMTIPWTDIPLPYIKVHHVASWDVDPDQGHIAYFRNHAKLQFGGSDIPNSGADATIVFVGPAGVVYFKFVLESMPEYPIYLIQTHLPKGPMQLQTQFRWYRHPAMSKILCSYVVNNWISQWKNDIAVWENKVHLPGPVLAHRDGPIMKTRRWGRQFFSESSKSVGAGSKDLDW